LSSRKQINIAQHPRILKEPETGNWEEVVSKWEGNWEEYGKETGMDVEGFFL